MPLDPPSSRRTLRWPEHGPEEVQELEEEGVMVEVVMAMVVDRSRTDSPPSLGLHVWWRLRRKRTKS